MKRPFIKMNGIGNDFIIFDGRFIPLTLTEAQARSIASRDNLITKGCDQVIIIEPSPDDRHATSPFMRILNADGSEVAACGNATRCVGWLLMEEQGRDTASLQTLAGRLDTERNGNIVSADMGPARFTAAEIPLTDGWNPADLTLDYPGFEHGIALSMGNPHAVFFVPDIEEVDLQQYGPLIERRTHIFPDRVNVSVAQITGPAAISLRVWERGAGLTQACGTAACATLAAAVQRQLLDGRRAEIQMPGGALDIEWRHDGHIWMTGPVTREFKGEIDL